MSNPTLSDLPDAPWLVLAMWQPWATLAVGFNGAGTIPPAPAKEIETRAFRAGVTLPCRVVIHATKKWTGSFAKLIRTTPFADALRRSGHSIEDPRRLNGGTDLSGRRPLPLGAIIGAGVLVRCTPVEQLLRIWGQYEDGAAEGYAEEVAFGNYGPNRFGWELSDMHELAQPIPYHGRQTVLYQLEPMHASLVNEQLAHGSSAAPWDDELTRAFEMDFQEDDESIRGMLEFVERGTLRPRTAASVMEARRRVLERRACAT